MSLKQFIFVCIIFIASLVLVWQLKNKGILDVKRAANATGLTSPLPDFLGILTNKEVATLDLWTPTTDVVNNVFVKKPDIQAQSAFVYDMTTNKILFSKNSTTRLPMASLTKVMTAIIGLENPQTGDAYLVHQKDLVGEDSMGLLLNEKLSLEDLLYGLFLHSANDASEVIASNYPKGRSAFIKAMNDKALALGLTDTHFTNPTGLEGDGTQYTTAYDLLVITQYGLSRYDEFDKIAATFDHTILQNSDHQEYDLENETNLLSSYPGVKGIKTGYTPEAGLCLITYLEYKDHKIIGVLLNSDNRRGDMIDLLDYSLKAENVTPPKHG